VSSRPPKDVPPPPPADGEASEDRLLTSEDLFGDLIDAPLEPKAAPARPAPAPIRVQVPEAADAGLPKTAELDPQDVGALLEAFGGTEPEPPSPPVAPPPVATAKPASRTASPLGAADEEDLSGLLDALGGDEAPEAPVAAPAAPEPLEAGPTPPAPTVSEEGIALDGLAAALPDGADSAKTLVPGKFVSPFAELGPPPEPPKAASPSPASPTPAPTRRPAPPTDLDSLLEGVLSPGALLDSDTRARTDALRQPEAKPASRLGTKFAAAEPKVEASGTSRMLIDLAGLAEDALNAPAPTPAKDKVGTRSGVGDVYGPYTLLERIATGGMAEVFKAKRSGVEGFEKVVAVKRILPHLSDNKEFVDMFIDEAKVVAGLTHPNIVQIFDLGRLDDAYFIAMEYVHGNDLRSILRRAKDKGLRLPLDLAALVASRVCSALEHAHKRKDDKGRPMRVVHRDVSPQNILISFEGDVKLTDFGIAKASTKASSTDKGALRGKLLYMSPEQASGQPMDRRSDIFSLGIVFYEMMTDRKPFIGTSEKGILDTVRECRIDPPSKWNDRIPEALERIATRALARDPDERYQDAGDMHRDLERALADLGPPTSQELARLMEMLFERHERGLSEAPEDGGASFELDFEEEKEPARSDDVARLLKKHGIGS
jgi:serine/threonine protein kinase